MAFQSFKPINYANWSTKKPIQHHPTSSNYRSTQHFAGETHTLDPHFGLVHCEACRGNGYQLAEAVVPLRHIDALLQGHGDCVAQWMMVMG